MQVHVPLYDPSSVMLLAVCSAQPKVHRARVLTRAVRSVLAQVCIATFPLLSFLVHSHASALYMLTKQAVPQFPSLQLYTSRCTLLVLLAGQLQNSDVLAYSPCHFADSHGPMLHHWSTHVTKVRTHDTSTPSLGLQRR